MDFSKSGLDIDLGLDAWMRSFGLVFKVRIVKVNYDRDYFFLSLSNTIAISSSFVLSYRGLEIVANYVI